MPCYCACGCSGKVAFKGVYRKKHQHKGTSRDPKGKVKRFNAKWNPINNAKWNPINNTKWKQKRLDADMEYL